VFHFVYSRILLFFKNFARLILRSLILSSLAYFVFESARFVAASGEEIFFSSFCLVFASCCCFSLLILLAAFIYTEVSLEPIRTKSLDGGRENRSGNGEVDVVLENVEFPCRSGVAGFLEICFE
jgi:hypothetical protein